MKIIIYGKGQVFQKNIDRIPWRQVVAIVDKSAEKGEIYRNIPVLTPCTVRALEYDYILVLSNIYFNQIRRELVYSYYVDAEKIVSVHVFHQMDQLPFFYIDWGRKIVGGKGLLRILDVGLLLANLYKTSSALVGDGRQVRISGIGSTSFAGYRSLYDEIFSDCENGKGGYDLIMAGRVDAQSAEELSAYSKLGRYILLYSAYDITEPDYISRMRRKLSEYGRVQDFPVLEGILWLVCTEELPVGAEDMDVAVYVVTHKPYNVKRNYLYRPICVGSYRHDEFLSEQSGENIAHLNEKINECTALYWIWKNTSNSYVGLNHYRRYFYADGVIHENNYLTRAEVADYMKDYDMILAASEYFSVPVREQFMATMPDRGICELGYDIIYRRLQEKQPDYIKAFEAVMNSYRIFTCNMFITRREILDEYCEWLFSFLIDAAEELDVSTYDNCSKRVIGYLAERMWTVWLMKHPYRIKELPITTWER